MADYVRFYGDFSPWHGFYDLNFEKKIGTFLFGQKCSAADRRAFLAAIIHVCLDNAQEL